MCPFLEQSQEGLVWAVFLPQVISFKKCHPCTNSKLFQTSEMYLGSYGCNEALHRERSTCACGFGNLAEMTGLHQPVSGKVKTRAQRLSGLYHTDKRRRQCPHLKSTSSRPVFVRLKNPRAYKFSKNKEHVCLLNFCCVENSSQLICSQHARFRVEVAPGCVLWMLDGAW